jgi:hypothetical protein
MTTNYRSLAGECKDRRSAGITFSRLNIQMLIGGMWPGAMRIAAVRITIHSVEPILGLSSWLCGQAASTPI